MSDGTSDTPSTGPRIMPGLQEISIGDDGTVYAIGKDGRAYARERGQREWTQLPDEYVTFAERQQALGEKRARFLEGGNGKS